MEKLRTSVNRLTWRDRKEHSCKVSWLASFAYLVEGVSERCVSVVVVVVEVLVPEETKKLWRETKRQVVGDNIQKGGRDERDTQHTQLSEKKRKKLPQEFSLSFFPLLLLHFCLLESKGEFPYIKETHTGEERERDLRLSEKNLWSFISLKKTRFSGFFGNRCDVHGRCFLSNDKFLLFPTNVERCLYYNVTAWLHLPETCLQICDDRERERRVREKKTRLWSCTDIHKRETTNICHLQVTIEWCLLIVCWHDETSASSKVFNHQFFVPSTGQPALFTIVVDTLLLLT